MRRSIFGLFRRLHLSGVPVTFPPIYANESACLYYPAASIGILSAFACGICVYNACLFVSDTVRPNALRTWTMVYIIFGSPCVMIAKQREYHHGKVCAIQFFRLLLAQFRLPV